MGKAASMNPADFGSGGAVPDGRYVIKAAQCIEFDYDGKANPVPAAEIVLFDGTTDYSQKYSAGRLEALVPSDDGTEFVHPNGEDAKINNKSNFGVFIKALVDAGLPATELTSKITSLVGLDLDMVSKAQEKRPGLKDQVEGKTILLPVKYHGRVKTGKAPARGAAGKAAASAPASARAASTTQPASNGDLDSEAIIKVQEALTNAKDNTLNLVKIKLTVWQLATKAKDANATNYRNLITMDWLEANADAGGWAVAGDTVSLA